MDPKCSYGKRSGKYNMKTKSQKGLPIGPVEDTPHHQIPNYSFSEALAHPADCAPLLDQHDPSVRPQTGPIGYLLSFAPSAAAGWHGDRVRTTGECDSVRQNIFF